uniref:Putative secreted protein n=1 Tax=Ixodes ricinus TaxID=34613 RepID=A0A6B0TYJ4_IXORI
MQKMWDWCMSTMCLHLQQANATVPICSTLAQDGECTKRATVSGNRKTKFFVFEIRIEILSSNLLLRYEVAIWGTNPGSKN